MSGSLASQSKTLVDGWLVTIQQVADSSVLIWNHNCLYVHSMPRIGMEFFVAPVPALKNVWNRDQAHASREAGN